MRFLLAPASSSQKAAGQLPVAIKPPAQGILLRKMKLKVLGLSQQRMGSAAVAMGDPSSQGHAQGSAPTHPARPGLAQHPASPSARHWGLPASLWDVGTAGQSWIKEEASRDTKECAVVTETARHAGHCHLSLHVWRQLDPQMIFPVNCRNGRAGNAGLSSLLVAARLLLSVCLSTALLLPNGIYPRASTGFALGGKNHNPH